MEIQLYNQPSLASISQRLRHIRLTRGFSLIEIQEMTRGRIMAATLGSYERCDRSISVERAIELATFYQVPLTYLLDGTTESTVSAINTEYIFDLRKIREKTERSQKQSALIDFLSQIAQKRSDWNGEVLSVRTSDLSTLSLLMHMSEEEVVPWLEARSYLLHKTREINPT